MSTSHVIRIDPPPSPCNDQTMPACRTIIAKIGRGRIIAHFDEYPTTFFNDDSTAAAVRRLLEGRKCEPGAYTMVLQGADGPEPPIRINWQSPELLFPCQFCQ